MVQHRGTGNLTLGQRIQAGRRARGWTQEALAKRLRITPQAVSKWETDQSIPDAALLLPLADALGVGLDGLLRDAGGPVPAIDAPVVDAGAAPAGRATHLLIVTELKPGAPAGSAETNRVRVPFWLVGAGLSAAQGFARSFLPESARADETLSALSDALTNRALGEFLTVEEEFSTTTISLV